MKLYRRIIFVCVSLVFVAAAHAQWVWMDSTGKKVYSDRPPPSDIPQKNVIKAPSEPILSAAPSSLTGSAQGSPAAAPPVDKVDAELQTRKQQQEKEAASLRQAEQQKEAQLRAQTCERARGAMATLESGRRVLQTNAKGEQEYLSDEQRSAEKQRIQKLIQEYCSPQPQAQQLQ